MTDKIDSYKAPAAPAKPAAAAARAPVSGSGSNAPVANVVKTDTVKLTGDALQLQQADTTAPAARPSDSGKVEKIRQAIADGSYKVSAERVAAKLTRLEWEMSHP